jgi:hypothetical protein
MRIVVVLPGAIRADEADDPAVIDAEGDTPSTAFSAPKLRRRSSTTTAG